MKTNDCLALLVASLLPLGTLAACSGNSTPDNTTDEADSSTDASPNGNGNGDGSDGGIVIMPPEAGRDAQAPDAAADDAANDSSSDASSDGAEGAEGDDAADGADGADGAEGDGWTGCPTGYLTCGGQCVPNDPNNCGACGQVCTGNPANSLPSCASGTCSFTCDSGYQECNGACVSSTPDTVHGLFVAQGGSTSSSCGTESTPCATIGAALTVASQSVGAKSIVYLDDKSTFTEEVTLPAGVTLQGGWVYGGGTWAHECNPATVATIVAPATSNQTVVASYSGSSTIDTVAIKSKATANPGQSLYGVFATGSNTALALQNVTITVASGGNGTQGTAGANGTGGSTAGCTSTGTGANGTSGDHGKAGTAGYTSAGFAVSNGTPGASGTDGDYGTAGAAGPCTTGCVMCVYSSTTKSCSNLCAKYGATQTICGGNGLAGCPGTHGAGGQPGTGGGASTGIFVYQAAVTINGGSVTTGNGGAGGVGGAGGTGGNGEPGAQGQSACLSASCVVNLQQQACTAQCTSDESGGAAGGQGGHGGSAGHGGSGAGGDSACIAYNGGVTVSASWKCTFGAAGAGGGSDGPPGQAAAKLTF